MTLFGTIGFGAPWLLLALLALPILWLILRAVPPAPIRRMFPGVILLLGLKDDEQVSDRTPWWLLLMRMLAVAAIIIGLAGPVLNPEEDRAGAGDAPLLVVMDGSWASAASWRAKMQSLDAALAQAGRDDRPVATLMLTRPEPATFQAAGTVQNRAAGMIPNPWAPDTVRTEAALDALPEGNFETLWFSDGLERDSRATLLEAFEERGPVTIYESPAPLYGLEPARFEDGAVQLTAHRLRPGAARDIRILAQGRDPAGNPALLAEATLTFEQDATTAEGAVSCLRACARGSTGSRLPVRPRRVPSPCPMTACAAAKWRSSRAPRTARGSSCFHRCIT